MGAWIRISPGDGWGNAQPAGSGGAVVVPENTAESIVTTNRSRGAPDLFARFDDRVADRLMVALDVVVCDELGERLPE